MSRDGFLERWSRRKLAQGKEQEPEAEQPVEETVTAPGEPEEEEVLDEEELAKLPSLDEFTVKTDLAPFLRKGVPQALKNAAMRKMWMLDPAVRDHVDFAVDYAWDWNTPGGVPGNAGTISQEGLKRMMDALKPKDEPEPEPVPGSGPEPGPESGPEVTVAGVTDEVEAVEAPAPEAKDQAAQEPVADDSPETHEEPRATPRPRRHGGAAPV